MARKQTAVFWAYLKGAPKESIDILNSTRQDGITKCKHCGSMKVVRYGHYHNIPRWWCKECRRKFADNKAPPGMKTPTDQIASALTMYYEGMGLKNIRQHLQQLYNSYPSDSTIYEWIERFTKKGIAADKRYKPEVGDVWVADETVLKMGGRTVFFWDIIDAKTRFLLASHISTRCTTNNARVLMAKAARKAGKPPKMVITDQLANYIDGIELKIGAETKHVTARSLHTTPGTQLIKRVHATLKARTRVMRGFKNIKSARNIINAWPVHYNYLRPHEVVNDNTPARKAGIKNSLKVKIR
jgi:putative transposase